jgi:hypothetical protein
MHSDSALTINLYGGVAQWLERWPVTPEVLRVQVSSSPPISLCATIEAYGGSETQPPLCHLCLS